MLRRSRSSHNVTWEGYALVTEKEIEFGFDTVKFELNDGRIRPIERVLRKHWL